MKIKKVLTQCSFLLAAVILLFLGMLLGSRNEKNRILQEENAETITNIAIVNLDEGIMQDDKKIFYSTALMDINTENFVMENIETAREGINNGVYAAYIVVPSDFSMDVLSINTVPRKATLEFSINPNLREDVSQQTIENIKNFEINLNTNMSYLYVQAILSEFHQVQDSADTIMMHDDAELNRILRIQPEELTEELVFTSSQPPQKETEEIDFEAELSKNREIADELRGNYDDFVKQGTDAFLKIKDKEAGVMEGVQSFYDVMAEIDVEKDEQGNLVYQNGEDALKSFLQSYCNDFEHQRSLITAQVSIDNTGAIPDLIKTMLVQSAGTVNSQNSEVNQKNMQAKHAIEQLVSDIENNITNGNDVSSQLDEIVAEAEKIEETEAVTPAILYQESVVKDSMDNLVAQIDLLPEMAVTPYQSIFKNQIIEPLKEEIAKENEKVANAGSSYTQMVNTYMEELNAFDAYEYYDMDKMNSLLGDFSTNMEQLEEKNQQNDENCQKYVTDTMEYTDETMEQMQTGLKKAYDTTESNVRDEVAAAQNERQNMNQLNNNLLKAFSEKLPYTRIGNLEYVQAYDFIVKPVQISDTSIRRSNKNLLQDNNFLQTTLITLILLEGIMVIGRLMCGMHHKDYRHTSYQG